MWHATSVPHGKSYTISNCHVAKAMPLQRFCGAMYLFQTKNILKGCFSIFFCRVENQNSTKLQGRKSYLSPFNYVCGPYYEPHTLLNE